MSNKLIMIRHGRSTGNEDHSFYKHGIDSAVCLTTLGVLQALNAGDQLNSIHNSYLNWKWNGVIAYASEYYRTQQTARITLDKMGLQNITPIIEPSINERSYGNNDLPPDFQKNPYATCTNGESLVQCRERFTRWWTNCAEHNLSNKDIVLFCHGELIKCATASLLGLSNEEMVRVSSPNGVPFIYEKTDDGYKASEHQFKRFDPTVEDVIH